MSKNTIDLEMTFLIQRLNKPTPGMGPTNPYSFGGGYRDSGLKPDALQLLKGVCAFDYMGAAEFEWGAVPKALQSISSIRAADELGLWSFRLGDYTPRKDVRSREERKPHYDWSDDLLNEVIYVIGNQEWREELNQRISEIARFDASGYPKLCVPDETGFITLKEYTGLQTSLHAVQRGKLTENTPVGWLELDNGFIFSIDMGMIGAFADMYAIPVDQRDCRVAAD